ncbi:MAG: VOC family protein [Actinomycetota bacterium]|nr:VOC family protein [Actinomycetota bacterium]
MPDHRMSFHHVELWVADFASARPRWAWLLGELGWRVLAEWDRGTSWGSPQSGYLVVEQSPDVRDASHDRIAPGMNHVALRIDDRVDLDALVAASPGRGWRLLFPQSHPYAGGPQRCAAYLEGDDGFEVEIVVQDQG